MKVPWREPERVPSKAEATHAERLLIRLHALVEAGYRPMVGANAGGAAQIDLNHPNSQPLTLWPDGMVLDMSPTGIADDQERTIIHAADDSSFQAFISSVPKLNLFHRIAQMSVGELCTHIWAWALFIAFSWGFALVAHGVKVLIFGR